METIYLAYNSKVKGTDYSSVRSTDPCLIGKLDGTNENALKGFDSKHYTKTTKMFLEMSSTNGAHAQNITAYSTYVVIQ